MRTTEEKLYLAQIERANQELLEAEENFRAKDMAFRELVYGATANTQLTYKDIAPLTDRSPDAIRSLIRGRTSHTGKSRPASVLARRG